jgi:hypothetical protein
VNTCLRGVSISLKLTACWLSLWTAIAYSGSEAAENPLSAPSFADPVALSAPVLERAFWTCDHIATTRGPDATPVDFCAGVYDELKKRKFGGDFAALLGWWKVNKIIEHDRLTNGEGNCRDC